MATARIPTPDGGLVDLEFPDTATPEQIQSYLGSSEGRQVIADAFEQRRVRVENQRQLVEADSRTDLPEIGSAEFERTIIGDRGIRGFFDRGNIITQVASAFVDEDQLMDIASQFNEGAEKVVTPGGKKLLRINGQLFTPNAEGLSANDAVKFAGDVAAFSPAGRAASTVSGATKLGAAVKRTGVGAVLSGATSAAVDAGATALGAEGGVNTSDVIADTVFGGAGEVLGDAIPAVARGILGGARATREIVGEISDTVAGGAVKQTPELLSAAQRAADATGLTPEKVVERITQMIRNRDESFEVLSREMDRAESLGVDIGQASFAQVSGQPALVSRLNTAGKLDASMDLHRRRTFENDRMFSSLVEGFLDDIEIAPSARRALTGDEVPAAIQNVASEIMNAEASAVSRQGQEFFQGIANNDHMDTVLRAAAQGDDLGALEQDALQRGLAIDLGDIFSDLDNVVRRKGGDSAPGKAAANMKSLLQNRLHGPATTSVTSTSRGLLGEAVQKQSQRSVTSNLTSKFEEVFQLQSDINRLSSLPDPGFDYNDGLIKEVRQKLNNKLDDAIGNVKANQGKYRELKEAQRNLNSGVFGNIARIHPEKLQQVGQRLFRRGTGGISDETFESASETIYRADPDAYAKLVRQQFEDILSSQKSRSDDFTGGEVTPTTQFGSVFGKRSIRMREALGFLDKKDGGNRLDIFNYFDHIAGKLSVGRGTGTTTAQNTIDLQAGMADEALSNKALLFLNGLKRSVGDKISASILEKRFEEFATLLTAPAQDIAPVLSQLAKQSKTTMGKASPETASRFRELGVNLEEFDFSAPRAAQFIQALMRNMIGLDAATVSEHEL